jgi:predicted ATPase
MFIYGSVGCGKTMAMDIFAACVHIALPHLRLYRIHLNRFLEMVHNTLRLVVTNGPDAETMTTMKPHNCRFDKMGLKKPFNLGRQDDQGMRRTGNAAGWFHLERNGSVPTSVEVVAEMLAQKLDVLCLDEMSITNLQNCVLLGPLLQALGAKGVVIIATSNKAPQDLYEEGLDRDLHLPILTDAIHERCDVMHLSSSIDYRKLLGRAEGHCQVFKWHCEQVDSKAFVDAWWTALAGTDKPSPVSVGYGRKLLVLQSQDKKCARFSFADLCTFPPVALGSADYAEFCSQFHTVLVSDVPRLRPEVRDAARRWTFFLDSCYENHIRVIMSTVADDPEDLLDLTEIEKGDSDGQSLQEASFAVSRCVSRLYEMQSQFYQDAFQSRLSQ